MRRSDNCPNKGDLWLVAEFLNSPDIPDQPTA
jgi:hypothetical protein